MSARHIHQTTTLHTHIHTFLWGDVISNCRLPVENALTPLFCMPFVVISTVFIWQYTIQYILYSGVRVCVCVQRMQKQGKNRMGRGFALTAGGLHTPHITMNTHCTLLQRYIYYARVYNIYTCKYYYNVQHSLHIENYTWQTCPYFVCSFYYTLHRCFLPLGKACF